MTEPCQPCKEDDKTTRADGFCRDCDEHMCQTCFQHHLKARFCRKHALLTELTEYRHKIKSEERCEKNEHQSVRYYCRKHDQVGCGDCMLLGDHSGCKPELIRNIASNFQQQEGFKGMTAKLNTLSNDNKVNVNKLKENRRCNDEMKSKLHATTKDFRTRVNSFLDKAEAGISTQTEQIHIENEKLLDKLESNCKSTEADIEECEQKLNHTLYSEHALFIHSVSVKSKLRRVEETIRKTKGLNKIQQYVFNPDPKLNEIVDASKSLGTLCKVTDRDTGIHGDRAKRGNKAHQIFVKFQNGKTSSYFVTLSDTIGSLKKQIGAKEGIPVDQMQLQMPFTGKYLNDGFHISDYEILNGSTVNSPTKLQTLSKGQVITPNSFD